MFFVHVSQIGKMEKNGKTDQDRARCGKLWMYVENMWKTIKGICGLFFGLYAKHVENF